MLVLLVSPLFGPAHAAPLVYFSTGASVISQVGSDGTVSTFASTGPDGAPLNDAEGLALDRAGNLYADFALSSDVVRFSPNGTATTFAANALLSGPKKLAIDPSGNLYASEYTGGDVIKFAPNGTRSVLVTGLDHPSGIAADAAGDVFVSAGSTSILKITSAGTVSTFATGFNVVGYLAFDPAGRLYAGDYGADQVDRIESDGSVTVVRSGLNGPAAITFDPADNLYVYTRGDDALYRYDPAGSVQTIATSGLFNLGSMVAAIPEPAVGTSATALMACALGTRRRRFQHRRAKFS